MKKVIARTAAIVTAVAITAGFSPAAEVSAMSAAPAIVGEAISAEAFLNYGTISVNGNGIVKADPEIATATIGVEITARSAKVAQDEAADTMGEIVAALKKAGIDEKDIQTNNYYMYQQQDWSRMGTPSARPEHVVNHTLQVIIRDIESVGEVLEAATDAGSNINHGVYFGLENQEDLYLEALELAIKEANKKAEALAKGLGVEIGMPSSVVEGYSYVNPMWSMGGAARISYDYSGGVQMQTGQVEVNASITMTFIYEKK